MPLPSPGGSRAPDKPRRSTGRRLLKTLLPLLVLGGVVGAGLSVWYTRQTEIPALVLVTVEDCLRSFDEAKCHAVVARALEIQANTAPRFVSRDLCNFAYGGGACKALGEIGGEGDFYVPAMIAIAISRDGREMMPLYYGPSSDAAARSGRSRDVYSAGAFIGNLSHSTFGGAELPMLTDRAGTPLTAADLGLSAKR